MGVRDAVWRPCTQMRDLAAHPPLHIERAQGVYLWDRDGNRYLDGVSSWWTNTLGHCHPRIMDAVRTQAGRVEQVLFANCTHAPGEDLAEALLRIAPPGPAHAAFACDGSSAVEMALKLAFGHFRHSGQPRRRRFAFVSHGYHGDTLGALSVCGDPYFARFYRDLLPAQVMLPGPDCARCPEGNVRETCAAECFGAAQTLLAEHGPDLAAVIVEPLLQCAGGFRIHPPAWLSRLEAACREAGALLILDEIATGFGRTGTMFAAEQAGVRPDLLCLGKGLTAGALPLSAVLASPAVFDSHLGEVWEGRAFLHSHSFSGNALACAAAVENLRVLEEERILATNRPKAALLDRLAREAFAGHPNVGEVRSLGMVAAVELVADRRTMAPFDPRDRTAFRIARGALRRGVFLRNLGDVLYFMPPYVIEPGEIKAMIGAAADSLAEALP